VAAVVAFSSRLLFIVGDLAWSAAAVLAARRIHHRSGSARR
jgi:biotin transporter BioY